MSRIEGRFDTLRDRGEKGLIVYLVAGDPSLEKTREIILGLDGAGVDVVEVGVPFSDPTADGPTIQSASRRALQNGVTLDGILNVIESVRMTSEIPVVLFSYYNPIFVYGTERFAERAKEAGVDGVLVVDLPLEEASELRRYTDRSGIDFISLIAPTTSTERIRKISRHATGFLYFISITGVTGTAKPRVSDITRNAERIREVTDLPLVVGFGISTAQQARELAPYFDGTVIGSAVVRLIHEIRDRADMVRVVSDYARRIKGSTRVPTTQGPSHSV
jgi:tryptophan synthase alpha chain